MRKIIVFLLLLSFSLIAKEVAYKTSALIAYAEENPTDIDSREILLERFYKSGDKKMILKYAKELHDLDANNKVLQKILKEFDIKIKKEKIAKILQKFLKNKEYIRYLNLYLALIGSKKHITSQMHVDALYCAVMSENFILAKQILKRDDLPMSPKLSSIMQILDKKIENSSKI